MNSRISRVARIGERWAVAVGYDDEPALRARWVVNAAGLAAPDMANRIEGYQAMHSPVREWAKGNYFAYAGVTPFKTLVYPIPEPGGLGIHLTLDLAGRARFGPNVEWIDRLDYTVDPSLRDEFARAIAAYWPSLNPDRLHPDCAGIRPKITGRDGPVSDFTIETHDTHGLPGIVNLLGIESPGLTASLSLASIVLAGLDR
jgi:L-2-hydroxyglutarate oxidase LhgO